MRALWVVVMLAVAAPAGAQSFNISFGQTSDPPSASYAAAGAAGTWNAVSGVAGPEYALVTIDGSASQVVVSQQPTTTVIATSDPSVTGDDAKLLDHGLVTSSAETCLMFSGMAPGTYEVLIYAWLPDEPTVKSRTRQDEAPSTIDVGGAWTGSHAAGVTYARYVVTVDASGQLPAHSGLVPGEPSAALNGIQIRPLPASGPDAGVAPPIDASEGTGGGDAGGSGSNAAKGGGGCAAGGGGGLGLVVLIGLVLVRRRR